MNGRNASIFRSMNARVARYGGHGSNYVALVIAVGTVACFWAMHTCEAGIEANAYISNNTTNNVQVIDTETKTVIGAAIPVGLQPFGAAATPDGRYVYVANDAGDTVSVINAATNTVVSTIGVGTGPSGIAVTPDAKFAYVTNSAAGTVSVIDTATNGVVGPPIVVGTTPFGVAVTSITPEGQFAYVVNNGSGTVSMINTATNTVVGAPIAVGTNPQGVAVTPNGQFAYVTSLTANTVTVISTATASIVAVIPMPVTGGAGTVAVTPDGRFAYVTNQNNNTVTVINTATNTVMTGAGLPVAVGNGPFGVAVTPDGKSVYVVNRFSGTGSVSVIDQGTNTVGTTIPVGTTPLVFGSFIGPNIIVATGGALQIANDAALTPLGFGTFVDFNGGILQTTGSLVTARTISLLALGGTIDTNGFDSVFSGAIINTGALTKIGAGTLALSGHNSYSGGTNILGGILSVSSDNNLGTGNINISNNAELLTTGANFSSGKAIALGNGGGTLASANGATALYGGVISGTGGLNIGDGINQGTIVLNALNTYMGGTTINRGILEIDGDANLGAASGRLVFNGGTLETLMSFTSARAITLNAAGGTFEPGTGTTLTADGAIDGLGGLTKTGAGTVVLSGNNGYTGGTTLLAGTLQAGSVSGFVSGTAYTVMGGTLDLNNFNLTMSSLNGTGGAVNLGSAALTVDNAGPNSYSGIIQGTGSLTKIGAGSLTLSGTNIYTGGTTVLAGTLKAGSAGGFVGNTAYAVFGGTLDLNNFNLTMSSLNGTGGAVNLGSAALRVDNAGPNSYSGIIQGTGSLTKIGSGALILSGNNTYSGGTVLNTGTLIVNSTQALGFGNVVVNGGVLSSEPQPINVIGNYTQNAGGTLQLRLGGGSPGQFDTLNVGGRAALDGTLQLFAGDGFQPKAGDKLTLILATGGVSGRFASVLDPFGPLSGLELVYLPNSVLLEFASNFIGSALTPNEKSVARELDKVAFDSREGELITFLRGEPPENLPGDFERISPDSLSALYEISFSAANVQASNLENRFAEIRNGSTGFSSSLNISNSPGAMVEGSNGKAMIEPGKNVLTPSPENKWGVWISGTGQFVNVSGDGNGNGYEFSTAGVSIGLDYRLTKNFAVGLAVGYAHNWTNLTGNGNIDVNTGRGGLYATFYQGGLYLSGYAGGAYNAYDTQRDALGGGASGSTNGGEFDGYAGGGYEFHWGEFTVGPIASLEYSYVDVGAYNETGSLAPMRIVAQHQDSLRTNVGLSASYTWKAGKVQLKPSLRASWQHEYSYSALPIDAQFASGAGNTFTVNGPAEGHDSALIDAGIDVQWTPTIGTYFGYVGNVGRSHYDLNSVICSAHWDF